MRKKLAYSLLAVFTILLLGFTGFFAWLLGTPEGVRWVFSEISRQTAIKIDAEKIEGRLWGDLNLEKVLIRWPSGTLRAKGFHIRWRPLRLLATTVSLKELYLRDVSIQDNRPEEPTDLKWPAVSGLPSYIAARIDDLRVNGLVYRRLDQSPVDVKEFSSGVIWRRGVLIARDLSARTASAAGKGTIRAGFRRPSLDLDLGVSLSKPLQQMDHMTLSVHFLPARAPVQLGGPLEVVGMKGAEPRMKLSVDAGIKRKSVIFQKMHLTRAGRRGVIGGKGEITFAPSETDMQLVLQVDSLDLSPQLPVETDMSGGISLNGNLSNYRGEFSLRNKGEKWRPAAMSGSFNGNRQGIRLDIMKGSLLNGDLKGTVEADWQKGISLAAKIQGRALNPSVIQPEWKGIVNLDLESRVNLSARYPEGNVRMRLLESRLHGRVLSGSVDASFAKEDVRIARLFLRGKGFDLEAKGDLQERLTFLANITDLSALMPDSKGALRTEGWLRRKEGVFSGSVEGNGRHILFGGAGIESLDLAADLSSRKDYPVKVRANVKGLEYGNVRVDEMAVKLSGTALHHEIVLDAKANNAVGFHTGLTGSYERGAWTGEINRLSGRDSVGPFALLSPAEIRISTDKILLGPMVLKGSASEQFRLTADVARNPLSGFFKATWERVNLAHLNPWLRDTDLSGNTSGMGTAQWQDGKIIKVESRFFASGTLTAGQQRVDIKSSAVDVVWSNRGLQTSVQLKLSEGGMLSGRISSSAPVSAGFPASGQIDASWQRLNLVLIRPWLGESAGVTGESSGDLHARWLNKDLESLNSGVDASGTFTVKGRQTAVKRSSLKLAWNGEGLNASVDMEIKGGGKFQGLFSSAAKPRLAVPEQGEISADWKEFDLASLQPWLPEKIALKGTLSGRANGRLLANKKIDMSGDIGIAGGSITHQTAQGTLSAGVQSAELKWVWRGKTLRGDISLALEKYGSVRGHWVLPLPARIPVAVNHTGSIEASFTGKAQESGLLTFLFPGVIRESHGDLEFSAKIGGTWDNPLPEGNLQLTNAGAYLPATGIKVANVLLKSHFDGSLISVDSLQAESGSGNIQGTGTLHLKQWHIASYEGNVKGKNFQAIYLPEYRAVISPDITVKGTPKQVSVQGEMKIPDLLISGPQTPQAIQPSRDVILVDRHESETKSPFPVNINVRAILGDRVFVKAEGVDAQLKGDIVITARDINDIRGKGTVNIVKGTYKRYGIDLKIARGRIFFNGGPVDNPTLDVLAIRTVEEVKAGVLASGTLDSPVIKLYSDPSMPDTDILSYIVLGHPGGGQSKEEAPLMAQAAGVLLSKGESVVLQNQLKKRIGIDVLDVETSKTTSATTGETTTRSLVTIGKYLTPKLYISYGQALMGSGNLVKLRYSLTKHFQLESESGTASGADLIYNINFK